MKPYLPLIVTCLLALNGCAGNPSYGPTAAGYTVSQKERPLGQVVTDSWISTKLAALYLRDSGISLWAINIDTHDQEVTLHGRVPDSNLEHRAIRLAESVEGVKRVRSQLVIVPPVKPEAQSE